MGNVVPFDTYKLGEMLLPSQSPAPPRGTLGAAATDPVFKDASGNPISSIVCGGTYSFDVPGRSQIWLTMLRNGTKVFDSLFNVPITHTAQCGTDEIGQYQVFAYDPPSGMLIGQTTFSILASDGSGGTGTGTGLLDTLKAHPLLIAGVALLLLMGKKK